MKRKIKLMGANKKIKPLIVEADVFGCFGVHPYWLGGGRELSKVEYAITHIPSGSCFGIPMRCFKRASEVAKVLNKLMVKKKVHAEKKIEKLRGAFSPEEAEDLLGMIVNAA